MRGSGWGLEWGCALRGRGGGATVAGGGPADLLEERRQAREHDEHVEIISSELRGQHVAHW